MPRNRPGYCDSNGIKIVEETSSFLALVVLQSDIRSALKSMPVVLELTGR